jgi:aspartokinase
MESTTTDLTVQYIKEHPAVKICLKQGLINYSSLSRLIAKELGIEKQTSKEAILIAARRFKEKLKSEQGQEQKIQLLLSRSELDIKNKIAVFILDKAINLDFIDEIQKEVRNDSGTFYILQGSDNYTVILQDKHAGKIDSKFKRNIIKKHMGLALITFKSAKDIENIYGVLSYLTSLFAENGVNILEFLSCWTDTLFVIDSKDVAKTINFLKF